MAQFMSRSWSDAYWLVVQILSRTQTVEKEALDMSALQRKVTMLEEQLVEKENQIAKVCQDFTRRKPWIWTRTAGIVIG